MAAFRARKFAAVSKFATGWLVTAATVACANAAQTAGGYSFRWVVLKSPGYRLQCYSLLRQIGSQSPLGDVGCNIRHVYAQKISRFCTVCPTKPLGKSKSQPPADREREIDRYIYIYISYVCMYIYIYIYIRVCVYIYIYDEASQVPPLPPNGYGYTGAMFPAPPVGG